MSDITDAERWVAGAGQCMSYDQKSAAYQGAQAVALISLAKSAERIATAFAGNRTPNSESTWAECFAGRNGAQVITGESRWTV